jgi:hypothetical protein
MDQRTRPKLMRFVAGSNLIRTTLPEAMRTSTADGVSGSLARRRDACVPVRSRAAARTPNHPQFIALSLGKPMSYQPPAIKFPRTRHFVRIVRL